MESVQPLLSSSKHIDKSLEYQYLKPWLRDGLITSSGTKWHSRRKLMTPIFHSEMLRDYFDVAAREARVFVKCLIVELGKPEFDVIPYAKRAALDVICGKFSSFFSGSMIYLRMGIIEVVDDDPVIDANVKLNHEAHVLIKILFLVFRCDLVCVVVIIQSYDRLLKNKILSLYLYF